MNVCRSGDGEAAETVPGASGVIMLWITPSRWVWMGFTHKRGDGRSEHFIKGCFYYQVHVVSVGSEQQHVCRKNSRCVINIETVVKLFSLLWHLRRTSGCFLQTLRRSVFVCCLVLSRQNQAEPRSIWIRACFLDKVYQSCRFVYNVCECRITSTFHEVQEFAATPLCQHL